MKKTEPGKILQADPELDAELAQMAEEVPPMPADFHDRWMNAIRAEAQQTAAAPEEKAGRKTASPVRWTRMLSVAAVFVFLIGGTVLYRNSGGTLNSTTGKNQTAEMLMTAEIPEDSGMAEPEADSIQTDAEEAAWIQEEPAALQTDTAAGAALYASSAKKTEKTETFGSTAANGSLDTFLYEAEAFDAAAEEEPDMAEAGEFREYAADETEIREAAPAPVPMTTGMPAEAETVSAGAEPEEAEEQSAAETEQKNNLPAQAGEFLADMGRFLAAALPYLAVLAVPAVIALIIRRRGK